MATKRFRKNQRHTKRKRGGILGIQNPNKSAKDNYEDWELLKFRYPADNYWDYKMKGNPYQYYDPTLYYYSYWKNGGKEPEQIKDGKRLDYTKPDSRYKQDNWSIWGVK